MARKKKKRSGLRNFSNVNIKLNIPWNPRGQGNKSFFRIIEKNPELKEYLTKERKRIFKLVENAYNCDPRI